MPEPTKQLSDEDMQRVQSYLNSGYNDFERKPFRVWRLLFVLWAVVVLLGLVAWGLGWFWDVF